jgi:predicted phage terminase large subunit-like protein
MVFMPPRHGKSEEVSILFSSYFLYRYPEWWVSINSAVASLAYKFSRNARNMYKLAGGRCKSDADTVKHWESEAGGGLFASGVGGDINGKGWHLGIIDDPIKNGEQARSKTIQEKINDWYASTFLTREEPWSETDSNGALIIIQTRWDENDLSGFLLQQERLSEESPERWHIVNFEGIKEEPEPDIQGRPTRWPVTCTIEPDWRQPGEALCPERRPIEKLKQVWSNLIKLGKTYVWHALYQQRPRPTEGAEFKRDWWKYHGAPGAHQPITPPRFDRVFQSWDLTFKETKKGSFVVGQVWGQIGVNLYLLDQVRGRWDITVTIDAIISLSAKWPTAGAKLIEDKANGPATLSLLRNRLGGLIPCDPKVLGGDKESRARAAAPYIQSGNVFIPHPSIAPWVHDFVEEFAAFPNGANDQVDTTSQAIIWSHQGATGGWHTSTVRW